MEAGGRASYISSGAPGSARPRGRWQRDPSCHAESCRVRVCEELHGPQGLSAFPARILLPSAASSLPLALKTCLHPLAGISASQVFCWHLQALMVSMHSPSSSPWVTGDSASSQLSFNKLFLGGNTACICCDANLVSDSP